MMKLSSDNGSITVNSREIGISGVHAKRIIKCMIGRERDKNKLGGQRSWEVKGEDELLQRIGEMREGTPHLILTTAIVYVGWWPLMLHTHRITALDSSSSSSSGRYLARGPGTLLCRVMANTLWIKCILNWNVPHDGTIFRIIRLYGQPAKPWAFFLEVIITFCRKSLNRKLPELYRSNFWILRRSTLISSSSSKI